MPDTLDLIADIGGTNARFALTDPRTPQPELHHVHSLPGEQFASLANISTFRFGHRRFLSGT